MDWTQVYDVPLEGPFSVFTFNFIFIFIFMFIDMRYGG